MRDDAEYVPTLLPEDYGAGTCAACGAPAAYGHLMCRACWWPTPSPLRSMVYVAHRDYLSAPTSAHLAHLPSLQRAAIAAALTDRGRGATLAASPARQPDGTTGPSGPDRGWPPVEVDPPARPAPRPRAHLHPTPPPIVQTTAP